MPSTRRQKAKARKSRELDMLSDYGNMDIMLGDGNSNSIERELDSLINVRVGNRIFSLFLIEKTHLKKTKLGTLTKEMSLSEKID